MDCNECSSLLSQYVDKELDERRANELKAHLDGCEGCSALHTELLEMIGLVKSIPSEPLPLNFHADFMKKLALEAPLNTSPKRNRFKSNLRLKPMNFKRLSLVAASLLAVLVIFSALGSGIVGVLQFGSTKAERTLISEDSVATAELQMEISAGQAPAKAMVEPGIGGAPTLFSPGLADTAQKKSDSAPGIGYGAATEAAVSANSSDLYFQKTFNIRLRVADFDESLKLINSLNGFNKQQDIRNGDSSYTSSAYVVRAVDGAEYENVKSALRNLGIVENENESGFSLTNSIEDITARIKAKQEETDRLFKLLSESNSVDVMVMVEQRLSQASTELDSYKGQLKLYYSQSSYPIIVINMTSKADVPLKIDNDGFFLRISRAFIKTNTSFFKALVLLVATYFFPFSILLIILGVIMLVVRVLKRRDIHEDD